MTDVVDRYADAGQMREEALSVQHADRDLVAADGGTVQVFEIYADSEAVVAHHISDGFLMQNWAGRFMDCVDSTRCVVFGDPNAAARKILDRLGATYHSAWGGFSRF